MENTTQCPECKKKEENIIRLNTKYQRMLNRHKKEMTNRFQTINNYKNQIRKQSDFICELIINNRITKEEARVFVSRIGEIPIYKKSLVKLSKQVEGQKVYIKNLEESLRKLKESSK